MAIVLESRITRYFRSHVIEGALRELFRAAQLTACLRPEFKPTSYGVALQRAFNLTVLIILTVGDPDPQDILLLCIDR